jgi:adenosylmethionine---8-amino-7-oxononanoate aminotransferase
MNRMDDGNLLARSLRAVWHPCTQMKLHEWLPLKPIARGSGVWLYDYEGKRYLDAISSWWVNLFGHANARINAALREQLEAIEHVILAGFTHAPAVELAEKLSALTGNKLGHCFFASDGSSAVEIALKMSVHFWRNSGQSNKTKIVCLQGSYHGETTGALSVSDVGLYKDAYAALLRESATVQSPDARLAQPGESAAAYAERAASALEAHLAEHHARTAAFIVEPLVQCASGMAMYDPSYLRRAREICTKYQVHFIADEIAVGFGRTGTMLACEQAGVTPDFVCLSKGLTGGYLPLSTVLTREDVYAAFYDDEIARGFLHSHSYTGNALACRAALASLAIFEEDDVIAANREKSARITRLAASLCEDKRIGNFRNKGMIWAFDVETNDAHFARKVFAEGLEHGVLLRPIGNTVYFMPPYVIALDEAAFLIDATQRVLRSVLGR